MSLVGIYPDRASITYSTHLITEQHLKCNPEIKVFNDKVDDIEWWPEILHTRHVWVIIVIYLSPVQLLAGRRLIQAPSLMEDQLLPVVNTTINTLNSEAKALNRENTNHCLYHYI